jgi:N-acetylmuramoyl-L-alanine amidase
VDLVLPLGERVPFLVDRALLLTLYGARASVDAIAYAGNDSLIRTIDAAQVTSDRARLTIRLDSQPFGYETRWDEGRLILRVRRPPRIDPSSPLRGLTIAVDPGHPPIGATGPTGLYEGDAVLEISLRLKPMLEALGATVVMTRTTRDTVALGVRPIIARDANAHAFVSIHLNAYPDGVNPFVASGTGTYFYYPHSERLARAVQTGMLNRMGLRNVGVFQQSFAVIRNSWMPAVLAEGAFVIVPEQEAALRTPEFQDAYARGVLDGLVQFFRSVPGR